MFPNQQTLWRSQFLVQGAHHVEPTFRELKNISRLWCSTQPYDPRCKSEHGHLADISATALATVMLFVHWLYCRNTQSRLKAHNPWIEEMKITVLDPKCLWLKCQKGGWKHRRQKSTACWYSLAVVRGLQEWEPWKALSGLQTKEREEIHQIKILGGRCHMCML